jgi:Flp pilus assembly pilin Flp
MRLPRSEALRGGMRARRGSDEAGQGLIEYGLILSLSAVWAALLLFVFGPALSGFLQAVGDAIDAAT